MQTEVTVLRVDPFTSKKGSPCAWIFVVEGNGLPFRMLCFDKDQVARLPKPGSKAVLYNDIDLQMVGQLKLRW